MKRFSYIVFALILFCMIPKTSFAETKNDMKQDMIYRILIDRFNDGNTKNDIGVDPLDINKPHGGDIEGIIQKLDYIKGFGYNTISLTPIFENDKESYDGFSVINDKKIDPRFGTLKDFKKLVKEAHKRKIKVILDFVSNNSSLNNSNAKQNFIDLGIWWMDQTNVDGYLITDPNSLPISSWESFTKELKKHNPEFVLWANLNQASDSELLKYKNSSFDAVTNNPLSVDIINTFSELNHSLKNVINHQTEQLSNIGSSPLLINYVDNEMTERFVAVADKKGEYPPSRLKMALAYLFTAPGLPLNFYGTEIALNGGAIPENRKSMDFRTDQKFSEYIEKLTELRRTLPSLSKGDFNLLYDKEGMTLFKRTFGKETTIIAINNSSKDQKVHLNFDVVKNDNELRGLLVDDLVRPNNKGFDIVLKRELSNVYVVAPKTGLRIGVIVTIPAIFIGFIIFLWIVKRRQNRME